MSALSSMSEDALEGATDTLYGVVDIVEAIRRVLEAGQNVDLPELSDRAEHVVRLTFVVNSMINRALSQLESINRELIGQYLAENAPVTPAPSVKPAGERKSVRRKAKS